MTESLMYFGLDKTVVKNISIKSVDLEHLEKLAHDGSITFFRDKANINNYLNRLQIVDSHFGILTSGYKVNGGRIVPYLFIDINKPRVESNNLVPQSINTYVKHYLVGLQDYIKKAYRLDLDFEKVKFEKMEINCTFKLNEPYENYHNVFKFMMDNAPKTYKLRDTRAEHGTGVTSYYVKNNSIQCKIYNKLIDLEHLGCEVNMHEDVCRIEYTLLSSEKIESVFGTSEVSEIKQEQLKEFFLKQFEKDFIKTTDKAIKEQQKLVNKTLAEKKKVNKQYVNKTMLVLKDSNSIFDVELLYNAIKKLDSKNGARTVKNFKKDCPLPNAENNITRLGELKEKVESIQVM